MAGVGLMASCWPDANHTTPARRLLPGSLVASLALLGGGCSSIVSIGGDAGQDGGSRATEPCTVSSCPDFPTPPNSITEGASTDPVVFALRRAVLDQSGLLPSNDERCRGLSDCRLGDVVGFDLDGFTTDADGDGECRPETGVLPPVDGVLGIDNQFGRELVESLALVVPSFEADLRVAHAAGEGTILVRVWSWNGLANDPHVSVALLQAVDASNHPSGDLSWGVPGGTCAGASARPQLLTPDGCPAPGPLFDEATWWWARSDNFVAGDLGRPLAYDGDAFVRDRALAMRLPNGLSLRFHTDARGMTMRLSDARAVFFLDANSRAIVSATVGGRWERSDFVSSAVGLGLCGAAANILDTVLRNTADLLALAPGGVPVPNATCDATSVAVRFESGARGVLAGIAPVTPPSAPDLCP